MYNRERKTYPEANTPPAGLESVAKELQTIKWIGESLGTLSSLRPNMRRDALISDLTAMLGEDPTTFQNRESLIDSLRNANHQITSDSVIIEGLKAEIELFKSQSLTFKQYERRYTSEAEERIQSFEDEYRTQLHSYYKLVPRRMFWILVIGIPILIGYLIYRLVDIYSRNPWMLGAS